MSNSEPIDVQKFLKSLPEEFKKGFHDLERKEKLIFLDFWRRRREDFKRGYVKRTAANFIFDNGAKVPKEAVLRSLIPDYDRGEYYTLEYAGQERIKEYFESMQLHLWEAQHYSKQKAWQEQKKRSYDLGFDITFLQVYRNVSDSEDYTTVRVVDDQIFRVPEIDPKSVIDAKEQFRKAMKEEQPYEPKWGKIAYSPWEVKTYFDYFKKGVLIDQVKFINSFRPAPWQEKGILPAEEAAMPEEFQRFFDHFFADTESFESTMAWMHRMVFGPLNQVSLVLNGVKGVGKNFFAEICRGIVGDHNFKQAKRSILESQFNLDLKDCLCLFLDEIPLKNEEALARFKSYSNPHHYLEGKGLEAKSYETFKSMVLNNNSPSDIRVAWDDRRFSVPDLSKQMIVLAWGDDDVDEFKPWIMDFEGEHYREFGSWLYHHADIEKYGVNYCHKGARFSEMVLASLIPWQSALRRAIASCVHSPEAAEQFAKEGLSLDMIVQGSALPDKWPEEKTTIADFLSSFIESDKKPLGSLHFVPKAAGDPEDKSREYRVFPYDYVFVDDDSIFDLM